MAILVTGGAGFIGSHIVDELVARKTRGRQVHVLDDLSAGKEENVPDAASLHLHDVRDQEAASLIAEQEFEILIHHAAQTDVRKSVERPGFDADVNITGLLNLMEAGRRNGLRKVIFASTGGAVYGEPEYFPQDEEHPVRPESPYGVSKASAEKYLELYRRSYGIDVVSLRYSNVYGPRQNAGGGGGGVVAIFISQMINGELPEVYGSGEQTRDYVYVDDVVRANMSSVEYDGSVTVNIGTGQEITVNEVFRTVREKTGAKVKKTHGSARPGEQQRSVLSYEKAHEKLGWRPEMSFEEGVSKTVEWFRRRA